MPDLSCCTWDPVPWPETKPRPLHWEHSLSHWTTREVPKTDFKTRNTARDQEGHFTERQTTGRYNKVIICITNNKAREFQKNIYFCFNDYAKAFDYVDHNCGTFLKTWEYHTILPASWEICMQVKKQQFEPDMEQWTSSKSGKEYVKAVYCHHAYLTYMQSTPCEMPG